MLPSFRKRSFPGQNVINGEFGKHVERDVKFLQLHSLPHFERQEGQFVVGHVEGGQGLEGEDGGRNVLKAIVL